MQAARKRRSVRRTRRRKTAQQFFWVYGNYIAAGAVVAVVLVIVIIAAVKLSTADKMQVIAEEKTDRGIITLQSEAPTPEAVTEIAYPFNLMSHDWGGEDVAGWVPYQIPAEYEATGGYLPECMQQFIYIICNQNGVDYALVLAMIEVESGYHWDAVSDHGAVGYMQIVERWHEDRMERLNAGRIENPYFNIMVGVDYLAELQGRFDTEAEVLTAYNYGVSGAYQNVWNKGLTETEYSRTVQQAKARIEAQLGGEQQCD